jgi:hypothetical protein
MSKVAAAWLGLLVAVSIPARGQSSRAPGATPQALLARAESLQALLAREDSLGRAREDVRRRATVFSADSLTVLLPAITPDATGRRIVGGAAAMLNDIGAVPPDFIQSAVVVSDVATSVDSVLRAAGLNRKSRVPVDVGLRPDTLTDDWKVATAVARAYRSNLDTAWRSWLPWNLVVGWTMSRDGRAAVRELMEGDTRVGAQCLAGATRACRLWFGLDPDPNPYAARFTPAELRHLIAQRYVYGGVAGLIRECLGGTDDACVQAAARGDVVPAVPAGYEARGSLLRAVYALHGPAVLRRTLADTAGSIGDRLARASGLAGDSLLAEWRTWLLTEGGRARVRADAREALPALAFAALLVLAAATSGRWR